MFKLLRKTFAVHPLEATWNIDALHILEAIHLSQDITKRGVRGIVAEQCFSEHVLQPLRAH